MIAEDLFVDGQQSIHPNRGNASAVSATPNHRRAAMVKGTLILIVAALSFGLTLFAAQQPKEEPGSQDVPQMVDATILQVDSAGGSVTVETTDKRKGKLMVDSETRITVSGKRAKLSDLKEGQQAKIAFNGQGKALSIDA
jgi:hypothetical protein